MAGLPPVDAVVPGQFPRSSVDGGSKGMDKGLFLRVEDVLSASQGGNGSKTNPSPLSKISGELEPRFSQNPSGRQTLREQRNGEHLLSGGSGGRCWIRRTRLERCLIVTVVICLIMLLGFIIGVAVLNNDLDQIERDLKSAQATIDQLKNPTTLPSTSTSTTSPTTMPSTTEADLTTGTEDTTTEAVLDSTTVTATETASDSATSDTTETIPTSTNVSATSTTPPDNNMTICLAKGCVNAASRIQESMSLEKDPCKNFYEFACGLWDQANPPNGLNDEWQTMGKMEALLLWNLKELLEEGSPGDSSTMTGRTKMFHKGCMNLPTRGAEATKPLLDILDSLGGFPMISPLSDRADGKPYAFDWQEAVIKLRQLSFANYPLDTYVYLDAVDATKHLTYVEETSLGMPEYVLLGDPSSQDLYDYQEYMYFAATFLRDSRAKLYNTSASNVPDDNAVWSAITTILQFETDLANITLPYAVKQSLPASAQYNVFTIKTLQNLTDSALLPTEARARLNWTRYFRSMFEPAGVSLTPEDKIIISNPDYLQDLVSLIVAYDDETIANYLMMRFILAVGPETTQRFQTYERTFQKRHHYNTQRPRDRRKTWNLPGSRTEQCVGKTNTLLGRSLGAMYVAEFFNEDAKKDLLEMAELIRAALIDEINAARWMDNKTTTYAIEKAKAMKVNMAYPDWIMSNGRPNEAALLEFYKNVQITEENHFQNVMNLYDLEVKNDARLLRQAPDKNIWITKPAVVNAFYSPSHNAMYFPAGFLQPPFYHLGLSVAAVNYGAFGGVIGHEIIHGFDKSGSTYDKDGSLINWWTNTTRIEYEKKTECFVEQYGNLKVFGLSDSADCSTLQINGEMTLDENMADNGGVRIAYNAFLARERKSPSNLRLPAMAKYTPSQLFFISHATSVCGIVTKESLASDLMSDEHAPWASRVVGTLQNMPEFSEAFGCIPRDPMNPVEKCTVW